MDRRLAPLLDAACVLSLVVIGTRNHDSADSLTGVLSVGAPFWIALALAWTLRTSWARPFETRTAASMWAITLVVGMILRNTAFNRGTALPFVIVASLFLFATMFGWRSIVRRRAGHGGGAA